MAFITMSLSSRGIWVLRIRGGVQRPWATIFSIWAGLGLKYGSMPVSIWYMITPTE
jgi:hypothetical protein